MFRALKLVFIILKKYLTKNENHNEYVEVVIERMMKERDELESFLIKLRDILEVFDSTFVDYQPEVQNDYAKLYPAVTNSCFESRSALLNKPTASLNNLETLELTEPKTITLNGKDYELKYDKNHDETFITFYDKLSSK